MEFWKSESAQREELIRLVVRLDPGDEIVGCLRALQERERFAFAQVSGLAAVNEAEIGVFDLTKKIFRGNTFAGTYEVSNLTANLTMMDGKPYVHAHMTIGDEAGHAYGGHLVRAVVSATGELFVLGWRSTSGEEIGRRYDGEIGLNLLSFS